MGFPSAGVEVPLGLRNGEVRAFSATDCRSQPLTGLPATPSLGGNHALVVRDTLAGLDAFVASSDVATLWKTTLNGASWNTPQVVASPPGQARNLFFTTNGQDVGGAASNNIFTYAATAFTSVANTASTNSGPVSVGGNGTFMLWGTLQGNLVRATYAGSSGFTAGPSVSLVSSVSTATTTPIIGGRGIVYVLANNGQLFVRNAGNLMGGWESDIPPGVTAVSQPALDVYRNSAGVKDCTKQLGVFYSLTRTAGGPSGTATLRALFVDSDGLDRTAPWPKYQRDNANTGNATTDISFWTCN